MWIIKRLFIKKKRILISSNAIFHFQAKEYFLVDGYVTDHIEILQDHSALYRSLIFFEEEAEARCKMHKRRIDMLEPICNGTDPK